MIDLFPDLIKEIILKNLILKHEPVDGLTMSAVKSIWRVGLYLVGYGEDQEEESEARKNIREEMPEPSKEKKRYLKEIDIVGIKILIRYREYYGITKPVSISLIVPPGLEELGYDEWIKAVDLIESMNISANHIMRDISLFVEQLVDNYEDRVRIYKRLLQAA